MLSIISTRRSGWESVILPWKETSLECEDIFCLPLETLEKLVECAPKEVGHYPVETMEMFSFPEYSSTREHIEARTLDYSHILNNLQM